MHAVLFATLIQKNITLQTLMSEWSLESTRCGKT
jgi:hypothetical protein